MEKKQTASDIIGDALCEIAPTLSGVDEGAETILARLHEAGYKVVED